MKKTGNPHRRSKKHKVKSCGNKQRHANKQAAFGAMYALIKNKGVTNVLNIYKCKYCKKWHVGNIHKVSGAWFKKHLK